MNTLELKLAFWVKGKSFYINTCVPIKTRTHEMTYSSKTITQKTTTTKTVTTNKAKTEIVTVAESKITERKFNLPIQSILAWITSIFFL